MQDGNLNLIQSRLNLHTGSIETLNGTLSMDASNLIMKQGSFVAQDTIVSVSGCEVKYKHLHK